MVRLICLALFVFLYSCLPLSGTVSSSNELSETVSNSHESDVLFSTGLWPGEGLPRFKSKVNLQPLQKPNSNSQPVTGLEIKEGTIFNFTETQYQTIASDSVTIEQTQKLIVTNYGNIKYLSKDAYYSSGKQTNLTLEKGNQINVLQNRAEGEMFFEYQGNIYAGGCQPCYGASYKTAWWVKVSLLSKSGWVLINENTVEFLERQF
ncbi:MAG: hypothetical protein F6K23_21415 [Okeania sp. SIO2C9]|uniref:hypothetical protein n=1 Tax=Okeania sp. SIO2C9 TaxID=2607791 RepID=UPI0013C19894|nr:hypothetical protein [Okeania sp. SIO2C9]NEQ75382.1 hypothetical protein [Okeania sp. SIO2C9]